MIKMFETSWFGISFHTFAKMNSSKQADESFYDLFYKEFYKIFCSYDELPETWKQNKSTLAKFIYSHMQSKQATLSIGCGNGYIEHELSQMVYHGSITALEPSKAASLWLSQNQSICLIHGYFPEALTQNQQFEFAYMSYTDYVFDDETYLKLLKTIQTYPINEFLLVGASTYKPNLKFCIKYFLRLVLLRLGVFKRQLWGYQRTIDEHLQIFKRAGYLDLQTGQLTDGTYWIKAING